MQLPRKPHLDAVRHTLHYVEATLDYVLFYEADTMLELYGYTDADWMVAHVIANLPVLLCFHLGVLLLHGVAKSNLQLLYPAQRLSTRVP